MKKQSIWVFQWRKSVHYWWSYILFSPECKELTSMLDPLLYRWGVPPVVIRCVHWTMQMWVLQTWIKALGLYIVMFCPRLNVLKMFYRCPEPHLINSLYIPQTSIHRLETPLGWASAEPIAFVMLMSTSRCTARHSGACRCAPIDFACPRGSRFQPKQGSDSSRRARDTAATMLHFTHFWRHRGESPMKHCQLYNCTCKKCVYMNMSDKNWPNNVEFRGNFHRYAPSTAGSQEIILTVELSNPKSTRATDWQIYVTCKICVRSQNCGLLSTHNLLIIHMLNAPAWSSYDIFFRLQTWCQNYGAWTMPESARCSQHQPDSSSILAHYGM